MRVLFAVEITSLLYKHSKIFSKIKIFSVIEYKIKYIVLTCLDSPRKPISTSVSRRLTMVFSGNQFQLLPFQTGTIYINEIQTHISALCKYNISDSITCFSSFPRWRNMYVWFSDVTQTWNICSKTKDKYQNDRRVNQDTYSYHFGYGKYCSLFLTSVSLSTVSCIWFDFYFFGGSRRYEGIRNAA